MHQVQVGLRPEQQLQLSGLIQLDLQDVVRWICL
jgi:hypothetical protein